MKLETCKICQCSFKRIASHVQKHNLTHEEYVIQYIYDGKRPLCKCGCGLNVTFYRGRFKKFVHSHACKDSFIRKIMIDAGRRAAADPVKRKKNSLAIKEKWKDQSYHQKIHNDKTYTKRVAAIQLSHKTPEFRKKMSNIKIRLWSDDQWANKQRKIMTSMQFRNLVSQKTKEAYKQDPSISKKISSMMKESYANGSRIPASNWKNINSGWKLDPYDNQVKWFDSGWEYDFSLSCASLNIKCIRSPDIKIPYKHACRERIYFPDFYLPDAGWIIEIKGYETEECNSKYSSAREYAASQGLTFGVLRRRHQKRKFNKFLMRINKHE